MTLPLYLRHTLGWIHVLSRLLSGSDRAVLLSELLKTGTDTEMQVLCCDTVCCTPQIPQKAVQMFVPVEVQSCRPPAVSATGRHFPAPSALVADPTEIIF